MGSQRDNRSSSSCFSGAGPTMALHSKHHNEKRNQELLLKRSTPDTPNSSAKSALASARRVDKSLMSKSLTLDLEKGQYGQDNATKSRARKKSEVEKSLKSVQRQTPSRSSMRMSSSMSEKEQSGDNKLSRIRDQVQNGTGSGKTANKKRESVTGKTLSPTEKKSIASGGENIKRADVFERLSRPDCNKGVTRSEHGPGNRIRDRSPAKTGRKSPQEKNVAADKHQKDRRPAAGDGPAKSAQNRRRDSSPIKKGDNRKKVISPQGTLRGRRITHERLPHTEEDTDGSREKLEKDNVPESPDKDLEETLVGDDADKKLAVASPGEAHGEPRVGDSNGIRGRKGRLEIAANGKLGHSVMASPSLEGAAVTDSSFTSKQVSQNAHSFPSTSLATSCKDKDKVLNGAAKELPRSPESLPKITRRESNPRGIDSSPVELSKEDVMMKVRQRVPCDIRRDTKDVVDDDKDVCETEKCEDDDFYKIKVQTRLVSYSNSTLIIRNTSKSDSASDLSEGGGGGGGGCDEDVTGGGSERGGGGGGGQAKECETFHPQHHPTPQNHTLQTSSVPPASAPQSAEVDADSKVLDLALHHEGKEGERNGEEDTAPLTRSRSMRLRLSQFMSKGKSFLTDVYSATQIKLEQYTRVDPSNMRSANRNNIMTTSSPAVILTDKIPLHSSLPNDGDSGYYSISTSLEAMHPSGVPSSRGNTCDLAARIDQGNPNSSLGGGLVDTPDRGILKNDGGKEVSVTKRDVGEEEEEEEEAALPTPPEPHVNFTLNEDWIKKNILCTCKCNKNKVKTAAEPCSASQEVVASNTSDSSCSSDGAETVILNEKCCTANNETEIVNVERNEESESSDANEAVDAATKDLDDDDLCLCSCHEGEENQQLHQLPQEVQELLDADHARMWWTITGNFGNILPIDWSKTYTRQQYLPVLNLNEAKSMTSPADESERTAEDDAEEEEVAQDLDLHHLILNGLSAEPVKSAEEVIKEIDDLMQEGSSSEDEGVEEASSDGVNANEPITQPLPPPLYAEKLNNMSIGELNEAYMELELVIRQYSETLINQLALRDELEYEKELKNSFISLLLQVQNKRRNFNVEKKKQKKVGPNGIDPKYLTTVIPYDVGHGPPQNETLQILIKILMAINEDSPTVPTLLTDYILKVLCPS